MLKKKTNKNGVEVLEASSGQQIPTICMDCKKFTWETPDGYGIEYKCEKKYILPTKKGECKAKEEDKNRL